MSEFPDTCSCGKPAEPNSLQCRVCRIATIKKWMKIAAFVGALLGFACSRLPPKYHGPCKTVAGILSSC